MPVHIAIAEDNTFALQALKDKLATHSDIAIKLIVPDGRELIKKIGQQRIDVILMDLEMPHLNGIEATAAIRNKHPQIKIIVLTVFDDDNRIFETILAGATGYLLKEESGENIHRAIIEAMQGGASMSPSIALKALNFIRQPQKAKLPQTDFNLTTRELEVLEQLRSGLTYEEIAYNLHISYGTVRKHIENIYRKLEVNNKVEALRTVSGGF